MNWLESVFSGEIGINALGIAGLVVMLAGAACAVWAAKLWPERAVMLKLIGLGACFIGAIIVIAFGK